MTKKSAKKPAQVPDTTDEVVVRCRNTFCPGQYGDHAGDHGVWSEGVYVCGACGSPLAVLVRHVSYVVVTPVITKDLATLARGIPAKPHTIG